MRIIEKIKYALAFIIATFGILFLSLVLFLDLLLRRKKWR